MLPPVERRWAATASGAQDAGMGMGAIMAYTAGVLLLAGLPQWPSLAAALPALGLLSLLALGLGRRWPRVATGLLAGIAGFTVALYQGQDRLAERWPLDRHGEELTVIGHVASLPELSREPATRLRARDAGDKVWRFVFAPQQPGVGLPSRIRSTWYRTGQDLRGGDCWQFTLRLKTPWGSANPHGFDYEGWLFRQGIGATATVRAARRCEAGEDRSTYPVLARRQQIWERMQAWLPADSPALALTAALVIGHDAGLRDADWEAFRLTGTSHLVAISGFNLAIVAGFAWWLLRWAWSSVPALCLRLPAQKAGSLGAAVIAAGYALLAGFEAPVLRALIMLWVLLAALFLDRLAAPARVLGLAWGLILLFDPFAVLSPGLWLSFGAVAAIFWLSSARLRPPPAWQQALRVQLLLSLALAPMTLHFFHGTPWIAPFVNLLAVPLFALLTPALLIVLLLCAGLPALGLPLLGLIAAALELSHTALLALAETHADSWIAASPPPLALALSLLGVTLLSAPSGLPLRGLGLLCLLPLAFPPNRAPEQGFDLTALDVGQGLAVVVRTANHSLLFDAGPAYEEGFDAGESVVAPYLLGEGIARLDRLIVSHGDLDHRGGVPAVRRLLRPRREQGALNPHDPCRAGDHWQWDGVRFELLHGPASEPGGRHKGADDNNASCVLRISAGRHAALLPADIERGTEAALVQAMPEKLRADVLLAPHHGSKTSSTAAFVAAVQPQQLIFPAGFRNHYRHPRPEVVQRYAEAGAELYLTGQEGALRVHIDPQTGPGPVQAWRRAGARGWWAAAIRLGAVPPP